MNALNILPINQTPVPLSNEAGFGFFNFNGLNLSDCGDVYVKSSNILDMGSIDLKTYDAPFQNGGGVLSNLITEKSIDIVIYVKKETTTQLLERLDELKRQTRLKDGKLYVNLRGKQRYTYATLSDLKVNLDPKNIKRLDNLELTFISKSPCLFGLSPSTFTETVTTLTHPLDLNNTGSDETYYSFSLVFNAGTVGVTNISILKDGYTLSITNTFTVGDTLEIDGENKTIKKNGTLIDYNGAFIPLQFNSNPMSIQATATSVNYTLSSSFLIRYN